MERRGTDKKDQVKMEPEMGVRWPQAEKRRQLPTVVLQETLESPLDSKEIKLVNPKGNQP